MEFGFGFLPAEVTLSLTLYNATATDSIVQKGYNNYLVTVVATGLGFIDNASNNYLAIENTPPLDSATFTT